jgi:hypothetical protein
VRWRSKQISTVYSQHMPCTKVAPLNRLYSLKLEIGAKVKTLMTTHVSGSFARANFWRFTGLAGRKLFRGEGCCGFYNFAFYIQNYVAGNTRHLSFDTRRRDGGANYTWGADEFAFLKPLHVDENARPAIDFDFFAALLQASLTSGSTSRRRRNISRRRTWCRRRRPPSCST